MGVERTEHSDQMYFTEDYDENVQLECPDGSEQNVLNFIA
jgi:hypothetical protein